MSAHTTLSGANDTSRVVRQVNLVGQASNELAASAMAPGSSARAAFEASIDSSAAAIQDGYGHGTHVAGVAAGIGTVAGLNTSGVAPGASIVDIKVLGNDGSGNIADVLAGIDWVIYNAKQYNIRVLNLSLAASSTESWPPATSAPPAARSPTARWLRPRMILR